HAFTGAHLRAGPGTLEGERRDDVTDVGNRPFVDADALEPGAGDPGADGVVAVVELVVGDVVQEGSELDDDEVDGFLPGNEEGVRPDALDMPPVMTRAFAEQLGADVGFG